MTEKINIVFSPSSFDTFESCECKFNYRYNLNRVLPAEQKEEQLDRGTIIHVGAEYYYKALQQHKHFNDAVSEAIMAMRTKYASDTNSQVEDLEHYISTMEECFEYWRIEDQNRIFNDVETPFLYLLYEDEEMRVYMDGKTDLIFSDEKYSNCPMDHKSEKRTSEVFRMSNQFKCYAIAADSNIVWVNKIGLQKNLKSHEKFRRVPVTYDPLILQEWKMNVVRRAKYYIYCVTENSWPTNETSCLKYNRKCEYYDVCDSSGDEAKMFKLYNQYTEGSKEGRVITILGKS